MKRPSKQLLAMLVGVQIDTLASIPWDELPEEGKVDRLAMIMYQIVENGDRADPDYSVPRGYYAQNPDTIEGWRKLASLLRTSATD